MRELVRHRIGRRTVAAVTFFSSLLMAAQAPAANEDPNTGKFESFHVILMFDQAPVHARFRIALQDRPVNQQRREFIKRMVRQLDANGDERLTRDEANQSSVLRRKLRSGTERFLRKRNLQAKQIISMDDVNSMVKQVAGQPVVFRQNNEASSSDEFIFDLLDEDGSGVIDAAEMATAASRLLQRDEDQDECIGFDEMQPPPMTQPETNLLLVDASQNIPEVSQSVFSDLLRRANERHLPQRLIQKYDLSGNGKLSAEELHWTPDRIKSIDLNRDDELSRSELVRISQSPLDIDLSVDVDPVHHSRPELHIHHCTGDRLDRTNRPGIVNLLLQEVTVTISYRHVEPIPDALDNARRKFNILDADLNGYLDEVEVEGEMLLQRQLFDQMDADGDRKLFSEELEKFVRERAEVKAMSCRVNIYDTGSGFFQTMDHNNDGRISIREMRSTAESLHALSSDSLPGVSQYEPARRFHIEFSRGSFLLFGPSERVSKQTLSFNTQVAVGPPWFIGSDRNNDGDLTWREFLGHREDFHFLDVDQDGLIDASEAKRAEYLRER